MHQIKTIDHSPISVPPNPLSRPRKKLLREELERFWNHRIMRVTLGQSSHIGTKKDGTFRLCVGNR